MSDRLRVLRVDDSCTQQLRLRTMLETHGFEVESATEGAAALARLHEARPPDVVPSDVLIPQLDGFELSRAIRADRELRSPVVLPSSAVDCHPDRGLLLSTHADAVVSQLAVRVFPIVDTFDAHTSGRPYRVASSDEAARDEIRRVAGTELGPELVTASAQPGTACRCERSDSPDAGDVPRPTGVHHG